MAVRRILDFLWIVYSLVFHGMDHAALLASWGGKKKYSQKMKVLIVRLDAIGDFILWLDAARELRHLFPPDRYRITLLGNRVWTSLAATLPHFDEVISLDRKRFHFHPTYRHRLFREIRKQRFDLVIQPTFSREFLHGDSIVRFSGAKERIGSQGDTLNQRPFLKRISDHWYTRLIPASMEPIMELKRNAEFLRGVGCTDFKAGISDLHVPQSDFPASAKMGDRGYYVLFPGATAALRRWPAEFFAEIAKRLFQQTHWTGVVCGSASDRNLGDRVCRLAGVPVLNLAGETSLPALVSVIEKARLLVGNETGAIHIAAAVSTPSVSITGGGHYGRFLPYCTEVEVCRPTPVPVAYPMECFLCNWICIYNPKPGETAPCILNVSVDSVWDALEKMLPGIQ